jgi:hypothetical protein
MPHALGPGEGKVADREGSEIPGDVVVHRIGGSDLARLKLKPKETSLQPPGISVFLGGTPEEAAKQLTDAYPDSQKFSQLHELAKRVASSTVDKIKEAGFLVVRDSTKKFPNHGRIIHPNGVKGFAASVAELAKAFIEVEL